MTLQSANKIRSVAVIGAGPVGAGITKALLNEKYFDKIQVFEKRGGFGGLWNYTKPIFKQKKVTSCPQIPCESAWERLEPFVHDKHGPVFQTAVYKYLDTNVPKQLMEYDSFPFPADVPLFPSREQVLEYLIRYSRPIEEHVRFNSEVIEVEYNDERAKYVLSTKDVVAGGVERFEFDAVAVATGFYDLPYVPDRLGLKEWHAAYPDSVSHAKDFDAPEDFADVKGEILIVGNSASGSDLAFELATTLNKRIYKSKRSESAHPAGSDDRIVDVLDVESFDATNKSVRFIDGTVVSGVEKVVFCTGYLKSLPFLPSAGRTTSAAAGARPPPANSGNSILASLITSGARVHNLYNHIVPFDLPTFGIIGLPRYVLPTRLSETQGAWLARVWSGRVTLPAKALMLEYERWFTEHNGDNGKFHDLLFPLDVQYSQRLNKEIATAGNGGYFGVQWDSDQIKLRSSIKPLKEGYLEYLRSTGKKAHDIPELEKAGYFQWPNDALTSVEVPTLAP
ncbi:LAMI_0H15896g1_1 [Lachancea mirantina]|uniref:LAMI_0H15896g1_1 n=1 Tax=Lachancea mirantina TaxID=1230905 RepID=A0A1G4KIM9_9SACH|nr:LAMI_0H15896g1_1 [Lachancea mirantina]